MNPSLNNPVKYIFVHHTAVSYAQKPDQWLATNAFHQMKWNFKSSLGFYAGYTYEISAAGKVYQARALGEETAAVIGFNTQSVSICLDGNFDIEKPTIAQMRALRQLLITLIAQYSVPILNVQPHRAQCGIPPYKSCYGKLLTDTWAQLLVLKPEVDGIDELPPMGSEKPIDREC